MMKKLKKSKVHVFPALSPEEIRRFRSPVPLYGFKKRCKGKGEKVGSNKIRVCGNLCRDLSTNLFVACKKRGKQS